MRLEHLEISFYVHFSASHGLKHIKICVTRDWNVGRKRSNNCILTDLFSDKSFCIALNHLPKQIFFSLILRDAVWYVVKRVGEISGFDRIAMPLNVQSVCMLVRVGIVLQCFTLRSTTGKFCWCLFQCFQMLCFSKISEKKKKTFFTLLLLSLSVGIVVIWS